MLSLLTLITNLLLAFSFASLSAYAQDGSISGPTSDPSKFQYSCDPTHCKLPACNCASTQPPGGLSPSDTPMFLVVTADDAVQSYTIDAVNSLLAGRKNPNGCPPKMTYYTSLTYTNFSLVTDWYVAGNEIADHTMTHVPDPETDEINGNLIALNALSGIPLKSIIGFRAPMLNYSAHTLELLAQSGFTYDSSSTSSIPVTDPNTDAFWPYTLDYGMNNDCLSFPGLCNGMPKLPGFWEFPMYALFDDLGQAGIHLMDPWLDTANGANAVNNTATLEYMKNTFMAHYNGNRQPFGLYTHPIHISVDVPGVTPPTDIVSMINEFIDWAQQMQDVWIVSNQQVLAWVQNPKPLSQLGDVDALKCPTPQVSQKICNGMPDNEAGLLQHCDFSDFPWSTCYGCPTEQVSPSNPNPQQQNVLDGQPPRFRIPANCSTPFWDPINGTCTCAEASCQFLDNSRTIGPNGENLTSGTNANGAAASVSYVPFNNGALPLSLSLSFSLSEVWGLVVTGVALGVVGGVGTVVGRI